MTRLIYIADSHFGADPMGYQMQPGYPERLSEIVGALADWMRADGGIDFVLHGGDMIDVTTDEAIRQAAELFGLPAPVHLCLGNHDTTELDAAQRWLAVAPQLFGEALTYSFESGGCLVHVLPTHWTETDHYWEEELTPQLRPSQIEQVLRAAKRRPDAFQILLTHSPMLGVPTERTGLGYEFHCPSEAFVGQLGDLIDRCGIRLLLGAHSHVNMRGQYGGAEVLTVSSLAETPFEFKLIEIDGHERHVETISLADRLSFQAETDPAKAWVHGRPEDRSF
jgi:hypothetical protein